MWPFSESGQHDGAAVRAHITWKTSIRFLVVIFVCWGLSVGSVHVCRCVCEDFLPQLKDRFGCVDVRGWGVLLHCFSPVRDCGYFGCNFGFQRLLKDYWDKIMCATFCAGCGLYTVWYSNNFIRVYEELLRMTYKLFSSWFLSYCVFGLWSKTSWKPLTEG